MKRFLQILFYGALTVGIFAYYYGKDEIEEEIIHEIEHEFETEFEVEENEVYEMVGEHGEFHSIDIHGNYKVFLTQGSSSEYRIESEGTRKSKIHTEVHDGVLKIYAEDKKLRSPEVNIYIEAPTFRKIGVHGAVELKNAETLEVGDLDISISGAAETNLNLDAEDLSVQISGAGEIRLEGEAEEVKVAISGAGDIRAYDLVAEEMKVSISGAGNAHVHATESLEVSVSGAGNVNYKGSPNVTKRISGFGSVKAVD